MPCADWQDAVRRPGPYEYGRSALMADLPYSLQHLMHVDDDAVGVAGGGGDEEGFHQPSVFFVAGLEFWHGAEIDQFGIDRLAALELLQQIDRAEAQAFVLDIDHGAIVGLEGVFRLQLDQLVGPDHLEIGAESEDFSVDALPFHRAAGDRDDAADAVAGLAGGGHGADRDGEREDVSGLKFRRHALSNHALRQPGRQQREQNEDYQPDQIGHHERQHADEDRGHVDVLDHALDHEH